MCAERSPVCLLLFAVGAHTARAELSANHCQSVASRSLRLAHALAAFCACTASMLSAAPASGESAPGGGEPELRRESVCPLNTDWQDTASARVPLLLDARCEEHDAEQSGSEQHAGWSGGHTLLSLLLVLAFPLYVPMLLLFFAWGLVTPILPLFAASLGAGTAAVGVVSASRAVGSLLATLPSGLVVQRGGVRSATLVGTVTYF